MTDADARLAQSVQVRLVKHAQTIHVDPNLVLNRYAVERFLYRLSRSPHADQFVLKGALLMLVWLGETIRPTRDADLLGIGDMSDEALLGSFQGICSTEAEPDGMTYLPPSIRILPIRPEDAHGGRRVTLQAKLGNARLGVQVDVGFGDAVVPEPVWLDYPSLLGMPGARLRAYRPETAIAEKLHAMVVLGRRNSRMRDFFDIDALATHQSFQGQQLVDAVRATFERRGTPIPDGLPVGLTAEFSNSGDKQAQWLAFTKKNGLSSAPASLSEVMSRVAVFLVPVLDAANQGAGMKATWGAGGPWQGLT